MEKQKDCQDQTKAARCIKTFLSPLAQDVANLSIPVGNERMVRARRLRMEGGAERRLAEKGTSGIY